MIVALTPSSRWQYLPLPLELEIDTNLPPLPINL